MKKSILLYLWACLMIVFLFGCKSVTTDIAFLSDEDIDMITIIYGAGSYEVQITDKEIINDVVSEYNSLELEPIDSNELEMNILTALTITIGSKDKDPTCMFIDGSGIFWFKNDDKYSAATGKSFYSKLLKIYKDRSQGG